MVAAFYPELGVESTWDDRGGNSNSVRNTELMMECNNCLYEGWNVETSITRLETWPDQSGQRMGKMTGPQSGHVQGQIFHEKFSLMFPPNKRCQRTLMCSSAVCWPGASAIEYS